LKLADFYALLSPGLLKIGNFHIQSISNGNALYQETILAKKQMIYDSKGTIENDSSTQTMDCEPW
jgi:hypothetical protein